MGWKIHVHDTCDTNAAAASEIKESFADLEAEPEEESDLKGGASIRVSSKVTPAPEFFQEHQEYDQKYGLRHHSHHSATNPKSVGSHTMQLTRTHVPYDHRDTYERLQSSSYGNHGIKSTYNPPTTVNLHHPKDNRYALPSSRLKEEAYPSPHYGNSRNPAEPGVPPVAYVHPGHSFMEPEQDTHPSNQQSKLIPDSRPSAYMSYGTIKYPYPRQEPSQQTVLFSRTPQHPIYHQQPRTQLMFLKKPAQMRLPVSSSLIMMNAPPMSLQSRSPVFIERKKSVYRNPSFKLMSGKHNLQVTKLMKIDEKLRSKIESKVSDTDPSSSITASLRGPLKPARNVGFNPDSIVIEGGFKPILKNVEQTEAQKRNSEVMLQDEGIKETSEYRSIDNFEPMFIPSPPDRNSSKKMKKKAQTNRSKVRLDDLDDMEMAADKLDSYYLPPSSALTVAKIDELSSETLITYDGKRVKDSNLARSVPKNAERPRKMSNSDALSRTPQFGMFRGDLPPPIPGDVRTEDLAQLERRRIASQEITVPELTSITHNLRSGNTKLTLVERAKRSPGEEKNSSSSEHNFDHNGHTYDHTGYVQDHEKYIHDHSGHNDSIHDYSNHSHTNPGHSNHDHSNHDHSNHMDHSKHTQDERSSALASAGQIIITNIEYIVLTAILYYII